MAISTRKRGERKMSDVALNSDDADLAHEYVKAIGGKGVQVQQRIFNAFEELSKRYGDYWTERKVRALHGRELKTIGFSRMLQLHELAAAKKAEAELLKKARQEHAEFIEKTSRVAAFLECQDEDFHSCQIEALRSECRGVDCSRVER